VKVETVLVPCIRNLHEREGKDLERVTRNNETSKGGKEYGPRAMILLGYSSNL